MEQKLILRDWKHKDVDLLLSNLQTSKTLSRKPYPQKYPDHTKDGFLEFWGQVGELFELEIRRHGGGYLHMYHWNLEGMEGF